MSGKVKNSVFETEGWRFEPFRARHYKSKPYANLQVTGNRGKIADGAFVAAVSRPRCFRDRLFKWKLRDLTNTAVWRPRPHRSARGERLN